MHLTNYSINKMSEDYVTTKQENILADNNSTKRTLQSLYQTLSSRGVDVTKIQDSIAHACNKTMQMYGPLIEHQMMLQTGGKEIKGKPF
jgi:hypothetical protein